jgi:hypothetical protein
MAASTQVKAISTEKVEKEKEEVFVYYCICGQLVLAMSKYPPPVSDAHSKDVSIDELFKRTTDNAKMLDARACKTKIHVDEAGSVCLKRLQFVFVPFICRPRPGCLPCHRLILSCGFSCKRTAGCEMQYRYKCKRCGLILLYKNKPDTQEYFIMDGSWLPFRCIHCLNA